MSDTEEANVESRFRTFDFRRLRKVFVLTVLACSIGFAHFSYVSHLFENDRNFSYLSDLEREMSFRTEMGFYYSYYKTVTEQKPFFAGIARVMYDKLVEYPHEVNAFNRFNIYPEVMIGAMYRYMEPYLNTSEHVQCHTVVRGEGLGSVKSCVGAGHPFFFYLQALWTLAGVTAMALFLHAAALSESILGGVVAVVQYFANHAECTRVQWAPNERENLALPLLLLQTWLLTLRLRDKARTNSFTLQISIFILNCLCLLFWQFTQFIFLTQTAIFFVMEQLRIIDIKDFSVFLHTHFCGLHTAVLLLQGNDMLKTSLYASFFLVVSTYCLFFSSFRVKIHNRRDFIKECYFIVFRIVLVTLLSFGLKKSISYALEVCEDGHIWEILYSKFTSYKTFDTMLYTCSEVFDFLPFSSLKNMFVSFLIPFVILSVVNVTGYWIAAATASIRQAELEEPLIPARDGSETDDSGIENGDNPVRSRRGNALEHLDQKITKMAGKVDQNDYLLVFLSHLKIDPAIFYNIAQMVVFGVMAALVMRLKLLFSTQMCLVSSLVFNKNYYEFPKSNIRKYLPVFWLLITIPVLRTLKLNVTQEMSHVGEFSDYAQEELLEWISRDATPGAFAGSMPISASVLLSTRRPIIVHPHYENKDARQRAYMVYKVYGKFSPNEVYEELTSLRATYLIVETKYCYGQSRKGCSFEDIWDAQAPQMRGRARLCHTLLTRPVDHFYQLFRNEQYAVFRVHDLSVRYMPRAFDT